MTPQTTIRRTVTALAAATALALTAVSAAGAASTFDPWASGLVAQYRAAGNGLDPWAVGLVRQSTASNRLDPWAAGLVEHYASTNGLDPWAVTLVRRADGMIAPTVKLVAVRTPQATVVTSSSAGFSFGDAAIGAGAAAFAILLAGGSVAVARRHEHHALELSA